MFTKTQLKAMGFNPRPRTSGRPLQFPRQGCYDSFNPRPRTSGRQIPPHIAGAPASFNPRPRTSGRPGI